MSRPRDALLSDVNRIVVARHAAELLYEAIAKRTRQREAAELEEPRWQHHRDSAGAVYSECPDCAPAVSLLG